MSSFSWSLGRIFGVPCRLHVSVPILLSLSLLWSITVSQAMGRGLVLWLLLLLCLGVRETARALAWGWCGIAPDSLMLLPVGGVASFSGEGMSVPVRTAGERALVALSGAFANLLFAGTMAGLILAISPQVTLLSWHLVTPLHLLRSLVWCSAGLGVLHLLPIWPLDGALWLREAHWEQARNSQPAKELANRPDSGRGGESPVLASSRVSGGSGISNVFALLGAVTLSLGLLNHHAWAVGLGIAFLLNGLTLRPRLMRTRLKQGALVRDVMLTDYTVLGAASTLEDALDHARHSLTESFPVVRGQMLVGAITRHTAQAALRAGGNGYLQGLMSKELISADPDEPVLAVLARLRPESAQLVPVLVGDRIVGVLTPQHLAR